MSVNNGNNPNLELVYLWIEDYKNIKKQGFNFSPKYHCEFDGKDKITIIKKDNKLTDFFGKNINITAITGNNGCGKSSIMEIMVDIMGTSKPFWSLNSLAFLVFYDYVKKDFEVCLNKELELIIFFKKDKEEQKTKRIKSCLDIKNRINSIKYLSPTINESITKIQRPVFLSRPFHYGDFVSILKKDKQFFTFLSDINNKCLVFDKIRFELKCRDLYSEFIARDIFSGSVIVSNPSRTAESEFLDRILRIIKIDIQNIYINCFSKEEAKSLLKTSILMSKLFVLNDLLYLLQMTVVPENKQRNQEDIRNIFIEFDREVAGYYSQAYLNKDLKLKQIEESLKNLLEWMSSKKKIFERKINENTNEEMKRFYKDKKAEYLKIHNKLKLYQNLEEEVNEHLQFKKNKNGEYIFTSKDFDLKNFEDKIKFFRNKFPILLNPVFFNSTLKTTFNDLSSGEQNLMKVLTKVANFYLQRQSISPSLVLLLDEPDTSFNLEWQRKEIFYLLECIKKCEGLKPELENTFKNIIITTHSPFILSDIPDKNIIFLDCSNEKNCKQKYIEDEEIDRPKTFGANIHSLLADSFFMESTIGEFAKNKIDKIVKKLRPDVSEKEKNAENKNKDNISKKDSQTKEEEKEINERDKAIINIIGEPVLRNKLNQIIKDENKKENVEEIKKLKKEKEELEKTIKKLEKEKNA